MVSQSPSVTGGGVDVEQCEITLYLEREYAVFVIKHVIVSVFVVYAGLTSIVMDGKDHTGDRTALILVSALIVTTSFQSDIGLGSLQYLIWWDYFNVMQIVVRPHRGTRTHTAVATPVSR